MVSAFRGYLLLAVLLEMHQCEVGDIFLLSGRDHPVLRRPSAAREWAPRSSLDISS
jgi:hypothetical protein